MDSLGYLEGSGNFSQLKEAYYFNKKCNQELWETIDLLNQTNKQYQETHLNAQLQLKELVNGIHDNSINAQYVTLKERFHILQTQFNELNDKYETVKMSHSNEVEKLQKQHKDELEVLKVECTLKCSEYEDIIVKLKEENDVKEEEYLHDIHTSQAESALRFDEMESNLQKLLEASNKKIRELNHSNGVLRSEMMTIKNNFTLTNSTKIQELESRLLTTENQLKIAQAKLLQHRESSAPKYSFINKQPIINKTQIQNISSYIPKAAVIKDQNKEHVNCQNVQDSHYNPLTNMNNEINEAATVNLYKETKKTCWFRKKTYESKENLIVPPLIQTSNSSSITNCVQVKRRKLYSLNDVDHLECPD